MIYFICLVVFFLAWGGIIFIIGRKFFLLLHLDLSQIPQERENIMKRRLLERKISRDLVHFQQKLFIKIRFFYLLGQKFFKEILFYLKNLIKLIKKKK
ncbi:hypothetical protein K9K85_02690 [Patescibacteria group bacterium]|nr:hypothetical protein [Patescibacteria group bacterium]